MRKKPASWSREQEQIVIDHYADSTPNQMYELLDGQFDTRQIQHKAKKFGIKKNDSYRSAQGIDGNGKRIKGSVPWNKNIKNYQPGGRAKETQFKPGSVPPNHRPVGSIRIDKDGYVMIKVEEGIHKYRLAHRETWKQHHGKYPPRGTALVFKDGNKLNCWDINNLELVTRSELMKRNSMHNLPEELKEVIALRIVIKRKIDGSYPRKQHNRA